MVIGDLAYFEQDGRALPQVAQVAMQQGHYVARLIANRIARRTTAPFRYHDRGSMAVIGRTRAVADVRGFSFGGYPAWLAWLFVHLTYLVGFTSRVLVLFQWAFSYLTFGRFARLITGTSPLPLMRPKKTAETGESEPARPSDLS